MRRFLFRFANLFRRDQAEREMTREIESHLALIQEDFERSGLQPHEAARAARRTYGGVEQTKELHRDARSFVWIEQLFKDTRYGVRNLLRTPGFTLSAALALAVGIGANAAVFGIYDAVKLKPLPVHDPAGVVRVKRWFEHGRGRTQFNFAYPEYAYLRENARSFSDIVAETAETYALAVISGTAVPERWVGAVVSPNYFQVLGVQPRLGRAFRPHESDSVIVISYRCWDQRLGRTPGVVGRQVKLNGAVFTIIGVAPQGFVDTGADDIPEEPDFWGPLSAIGTLEPLFGPAPNKAWRVAWRDASHPGFYLLGRLKKSVPRQAAQAEADSLLRTYLRSYRESDRTISFTLEKTSYFGASGFFDGLRWLPLGLWVITSLVLLVASANVANMLLARTAARRSELAIRMALGASRGRVVRQLLVENLLLAVLGGIVGLPLSIWAARLLWLAISGVTAGYGANLVHLDLQPDAEVFGYGLLVSSIAAMLFGIAPSFRSTGVNLMSMIKQAGSGLGSGLRPLRLRNLLLGAQVMVSTLLLATSGDMISMLRSAKISDLGYETRMTYLLAKDDNPATVRAINQRLRDRLEKLPEVGGVATGSLPGQISTIPITVGNSNRRTLLSYASDAYFDVMGIHPVRGRVFTRQEATHAGDGNMRLAVISESTARHLWPGEDALGKTFSIDPNAHNNFKRFEVIGIVKDVRFSELEEVDRSHVYLPDNPAQLGAGGLLLLRLRGNREKALSAVQSAVESVDRSLLPGLLLISVENGPVGNIRGFYRIISTTDLSLMALSLGLAAIGIYGVMAFLVTQRTREIGIRVAAGASPFGVIKGFVLQGLRPVFMGIAAGVVAASALGVWLESQEAVPDPILKTLFGDPALYIELAVILAVASLASAVPARRAVRVDPVVALRYE